MKLSKMGKIWSAATGTRVLEGGKASFLFYFFLTHALNVAKSSFGPLPRSVVSLMDSSKKRFVIQNGVGIFHVRPFNDSLTISADYFESELKRWVGMPKGRNVCIDIGANIGRYTLLAAREFAYERVVSVEANPITFDVLKKNISLNGLEEKVSLVQVAVSDNSEPVSFEVDKQHLGGGKVVDKASGVPQWDTVVTVPAITVDELCKEQNVAYSSVDFVKMDVEGFECEVLAGMQQTLKGMPAGSSMMIEISEKNKEKCISSITDAGFSLVESSNCDYLFSK
ncbi:MAG TPA: FkbM family methyltransferase [Candidatus Paceibacterota bacterium]